MRGDQATTPRATADRRRIGVWENEGGCLEELPARPEVVTERWLPAVNLSDLPDEAVMGLDLEGVAICLARSRGTVYALLDECSHGQVLLSEGEVADGLVECWLHGSCFDLVTGKPTGPPAVDAVPVYRVRVVDDVVEVDLSPTGLE